MGLADRSSVCDGQCSLAQRLPEPKWPSDLFLTMPSLGTHLTPPCPSPPTSPGMGKDDAATSSKLPPSMPYTQHPFP